MGVFFGGTEPDEDVKRKYGLGLTGRHPIGRLGPDDQGEIRCAIAADPDHQLVRIEFGKPVAWLALPPGQAVALAEKLVDKAQECYRHRARGMENSEG